MVTILEQNTTKNCVLTDTSVEKRFRLVVLNKQRAEQITSNDDNMTYDADFFLVVLPCRSCSVLWYNQACSFLASLFTVSYHQESHLESFDIHS